MTMLTLLTYCLLLLMQEDNAWLNRTVRRAAWLDLALYPHTVPTLLCLHSPGPLPHCTAGGREGGGVTYRAVDAHSARGLGK